MSNLEDKLKTEVQSLISEVPVENLSLLIEFMKSLIAKRNLRPLEEHLADPVYDDEPETAEGRSAIFEAREDVKEGRIYDLDTVAKELGICLREK